MSEAHALHRREFLQAGAVATAAALAAAPGPAHSQETKARTELPRRRLGRTGVDVTILNQGTWRAPGALDRLLRFAYAQGIRYFDTAKSYGSEGGFKRWFQAMPEVRKEIFLVTKDHPRTPRELARQIDERLEALGTDYLDLIFIHALGDHDIATEIEWPKSREFQEAAEAIRKSGKCRFVGFSTHHPRRAEILQNAAKGGFVDVIMLQLTGWLPKDSALDRALDACHKAGIGLVSMKQVAGQLNTPTNPLNQVYERAPVLKEKGLTPYQGLLHAIWTDERISSSCVSMRTLDQVRENAEAARRFEPLTTAQIHQIRDACLAAGPTLCADCDGRCARAGGTEAALGELTRFLTYHEHHGYRGEARRLYHELTGAQRAWQGADLEAARNACPNRLDFARLLPEADRLLA
jgi:aryl-alcohol dehydrogenase-like predicted oxidoreductase